MYFSFTVYLDANLIQYVGSYVQIFKLSKFMVKKQLTKEQCAQFNNMRLDLRNAKFNKERLERLFSQMGLKLTPGFLSALVRRNCIVRADKGVYQFPKDPVHYNILNLAYTERHYYKRKPSSSSNDKELTIEKCVEFLKSRKYYRIYKATINLDRALDEKDKTARELVEWVEL